MPGFGILVLYQYSSPLPLIHSVYFSDIYMATREEEPAGLFMRLNSKQLWRVGEHHRQIGSPTGILSSCSAHKDDRRVTALPVWAFV